MQALTDAFAGFTIRGNVPLSECGSFRIGGPVRTLIECGDPARLGQIRAKLWQLGLPAVLIGSGTNLLFSDEGWPGCMVRYTAPFSAPAPERDGTWRVHASVPLDALSAWACERGWTGWEAFSGIPGTLGGAVTGNAGAWGTQIGDFVHSLSAWDPEGKALILSRTDCGFTYRNSRLKESGLWVADLRLTEPEKIDPALLAAERQRVLAARAEKHPDWRQTPCIGSFFKNVEPSSAAGRRRAAGWFLEQVGAKELRVGGAGVYHKHANIPVKQTDGCSAADVLALVKELRERVHRQFGLVLEPEVRFLHPEIGFTFPI